MHPFIGGVVLRLRIIVGIDEYAPTLKEHSVVWERHLNSEL